MFWHGGTFFYGGPGDGEWGWEVGVGVGVGLFYSNPLNVRTAVSDGISAFRLFQKTGDRVHLPEAQEVEEEFEPLNCPFWFLCCYYRTSLSPGEVVNRIPDPSAPPFPREVLHSVLVTH